MFESFDKKFDRRLAKLGLSAEALKARETQGQAAFDKLLEVEQIASRIATLIGSGVETSNQALKQAYDLIEAGKQEEAMTIINSAIEALESVVNGIDLMPEPTLDGFSELASGVSNVLRAVLAENQDKGLIDIIVSKKQVRSFKIKLVFFADVSDKSQSEYVNYEETVSTKFDALKDMRETVQVMAVNQALEKLLENFDMNLPRMKV